MAPAKLALVKDNLEDESELIQFLMSKPIITSLLILASVLGGVG